jgi:hypothetical protein
MFSPNKPKLRQNFLILALKASSPARQLPLPLAGNEFTADDLKISSS